MSRTELLLGEDAVFTDGDRLEIDIRQPWYRSLPLSSVVDIEVSIAGRPVDRERIRLRINGVERSIAETGQIWDEVWFIQDAGTVVIDGAGVGVGDAVEVTVVITQRFPYIIIEGFGPLRRRTEATRTEVARERSAA